MVASGQSVRLNRRPRRGELVLRGDKRLLILKINLMASCCLETNEHLPPRLEQSQAFCSACSPLSNPGLAFPFRQGGRGF